MLNSNGKESVDSTSFRSILNGVKRMREQYNVDNHEDISAIRMEVQPQQDTQSVNAISDRSDQPNKVPSENESVKTSLPSSNHEVHRNNERLNSIKSNSISNPSNTTKSNNRINARASNVQTYSSVQVSQSQKGNPLLTNSLMKSIPWSYNGSILSDYYINPTLQILFLSLKYHKLHPEYIWQRLKKLNKGSTIVETSNDRVLRLLLVVVDIDAHQEILRKLLNLCIKQDLSLVLAWSFEEAGNYIAFCKQYEMSSSKVKSAIKGTKSIEYQACVVDTLTGIRSVNKTDSVKLLANCGSVKNIVLQSCKSNEDGGLNNIQGLGSRKLLNMRSVFLEPFIYNKEYD
mmetsp:Transcript_6503/g.8148  ORF Transcript_6503/g.8148 Transcript_6503/m.8148 type:complete len:345 (+) Transcript_6503:31-1065(+)